MMSPSTSRSRRWIYGWLHSDLIGIPVTLAVSGIAAASVALYLVIGKWAGLFVGKLLFILGLGGLLALIVLLEGRRGETTDGVTGAPAEGPRRVLVVANEGLDQPALCAEVCQSNGERPREALIVAPVLASSRLHALADDVDIELHQAQERLDAAVATLTDAGIKAAGHADICTPMRCLVDGLREFAATDVVMLRDGEPGWKDAESFAEQLRTELGLYVTEVDSSKIALAA